MRTKYARYAIIVAVLLLLIGGGSFALLRGGSKRTQARTEEVSPGDLVYSVSASGTLEPSEAIDVGAQVAGLIKEFGVGMDKKPIDYRSEVEEGTVLARIDDSIYQAKVDQSRAQVSSMEQQLNQARAKLDQAKAGVEQALANTKRAEADLKQVQAREFLSSRDWNRIKSLEGSGSLSQVEFDTAKSVFDANRAAVTVSEATLSQVRAAETNSRAMVADAEAAVGVATAAIATAKATLKQDELNLSYCTIRSPVRGTIIDRRVTLGQTIQPSFNAPSLFLLARDLSQMTVWASVNEADIGQIRVGQTARFTVDAHSNRTFIGSVSRIRLNATNVSNVVVYTVEITTANPDRVLLPYMTANVQFEIERHSKVTRVSNSALRYKPSPQVPVVGPMPEKEKANQGVVWVEEANGVRPVVVTLGLSDGNRTEVLDDAIAVGTKLVTGEVKPNAPASGGGNPFGPTAPGGKAK